jgi:hypothetical protein
MSTLLTNRSSVSNMVTIVTVTTMTLVTLSTLFCLFFLVGFVDDAILVVYPRLTSILQRIHKHLCDIAEWEKEKRASWIQEENIDNRFHSLITNLAGVMNDYIKNTK